MSVDLESLPPPEPAVGEKRPESEYNKWYSLDARIERILGALRVSNLEGAVVDHVGGLSDTVDAVVSGSNRTTWQHVKAFKHRAQIEAISRHCILRLPASCDLIVELGAGQAVLGHAVSQLSGVPLVAVDRRGNSTAFEDSVYPDAPPVSRVTADIAEGGFCPEEAKNVCLLAKHLCGHGSDLAVDAALELGPRLGLLCLAPCCHSKMLWRSLLGRTRVWLEEAGFCNCQKDFSMLLDVIRLGRTGSKGQPGGPCPKWRMRNFVRDDEIQPLSQRACRVIDESRIARLRAAGFEVTLVEYCSADITPDNVLLLAAPVRGTLSQLISREPLREERNVSAEAFTIPDSCILLELDPKCGLTLPQRVISYILEQRLSRFSSLRLVRPLTGSSTAPAVLMESLEGRLKDLLREVLACTCLSRSMTRVLALDTAVFGTEELVVAVSQLLSETGELATLRVSGRPKSLESSMCKVLGSERLAPATFTHTLCVTRELGATGTGGTEIFRFSVLPREVLDPTACSARARAEALGPRIAHMCSEVALRCERRLRCVSAVAVWTDQSESETWVLDWADRFFTAGATVTELRLHPWVYCRKKNEERSVNEADVKEREDCGCRHGEAGDLVVTRIGAGEVLNAADVLLCHMSEGVSETLIGMLSALLKAAFAVSALKARGVGVVRLRCGRSGRAVKRWHRHTTRLFEKIGASHIEILHLLSDRELERTVVFQWFICHKDMA